MQFRELNLLNVTVKEWFRWVSPRCLCMLPLPALHPGEAMPGPC